MKILLVSNMYPSEKYPHYGVFVENTYDILLGQDGLIVNKIVITKSDKRLEKIFKYFMFYLKIIFAGVFLHYDIIYGHFASHIAVPLLILKAIKPKIRLVINVHGNDVVPDCEKDSKWSSLVRNLLEKTEYVIVPSLYYKKVMISEYSFCESNIVVFPSGGVNHNVFKKMSRKEIYARYDLNEKKTYVGYVSRIEKNKGWDTFLKAAALMKDNSDINFIVVGSGNELDEFDNLVKELDLTDRIVKYDLLSQCRIAELFNIMEVFCFPTYRKSESLGLVGLEAMACECLVVASTADGPGSYMKNGLNGLLFKECDEHDLKNKIEAMLAMNDVERDIMISEAKGTAAEYDGEKIKGILQDFFLKI